jgi:hypothetical protein
VLISKNTLTYNGLAYDYKSFFENIKLLKKRCILILDEDVYIKKVNINSKKILNEDIEKIKEESFGKDEEYLIDYKINEKGGILYIYAIKGGMKVLKVCDGANKAQVIPLQMYVMEKLRKKIKEKSYKCVFTYNDIYYYYSFKEGFVEESRVYKDVDILLEKISKVESQDILYIEEGVNNLNFSDRTEVRQLKGVLDERIFI